MDRSIRGREISIAHNDPKGACVRHGFSGSNQNVLRHNGALSTTLHRFQSLSYISNPSQMTDIEMFSGLLDVLFP